MLKNKMIWILVLAIVAVVGFFAWQISGLRLKKETSYKTGQVCINNNCFAVELAENNFQIEKGLMFRESLAENKGMLFIFNKEADYPFWMKNTKIALDIVWINEKKEVVYISQFTQPCTTFFCPQINSQKNAKYVLEINSGLCQKFGIKVGDLLTIK